MRANRRRICLALSTCGLALGVFGSAPALLGQAVSDQSERLVYVPPDLGAPPTRTLAAARGPNEAPAVHVLAPEQTGLAGAPSPRLVWYLTRPLAARIEVTLLDDLATLLELDLGAIATPGTQVVDLARHGVRLAPGRDYRWSVAQVVDPDHRSADVVASAAIRIAPPEGEIATRLASASGRERLELLAENGYWYDLIAELSASIEAKPEDRTLRALRIDLLHQVGLAKVAELEAAAL